MVKIEEGKFYRTRRGERVGPARARDRKEENNVDLFPWRIGSQTFTNDGGFWEHNESENDLIGEDLGETATMGDILDGIRRAVHNPLNKGIDVDRVVLDGKTWVRQDAAAPAKPVELPRWKSHKIVQAARIVSIITKGSDVQDGTILALRVDHSDHKHGLVINIAEPEKMFARYRPKLGDYFVRYDGGYESISPAKEFEEGYSRMPHGSHDVVRGGGTCSCGVTVEQLLDGVANLECPHRPFRR